MSKEESKNPEQTPKPLFDVKIVRLSTGEHIICQLDSRGAKKSIMIRPMGIFSIPMKTKNGEIKYNTVMFKSWIEFSSDLEYEIPKSYIMNISEPCNDILREYENAKNQEDLIRSEENDSGVHGMTGSSGKNGKKSRKSSSGNNNKKMVKTSGKSEQNLSGFMSLSDLEVQFDFKFNPFLNYLDS